MQRFTLISLILFLASFSSARAVESFEVLFTNPNCDEYRYETPVESNNGELLFAKPQNAYCKPADRQRSDKRHNTPFNRLLAHIENPEVRLITLANLNITHRDLVRALCQRLRAGITLELILDGKPGETRRDAEYLKTCGDAQVYYRGNQGNLGFFHIKLAMFNRLSEGESKIVFTSGNFSVGGLTLHHENWNFVRAKSTSHFAQVHNCMIDAVLNHGTARGEFNRALNNCRTRITAPENPEFRVFVAPTDNRAALQVIEEQGRNSQRIEIAAHRFSGRFVSLLSTWLDESKDVRLVMDDDLYWSNRTRSNVGMNSRQEANNIFRALRNRLSSIRFLETNHDAYLVHHNKFMIFSSGSRGAVFTGSGNFSNSAFDNNFENSYLITNLAVLRAYRSQHLHLWEELATPQERLPVANVLP
jgi:phosphatidylserine/phosphatidylglycerophosphate/cardiolipin synthase-like enzyme